MDKELKAKLIKKTIGTKNKNKASKKEFVGARLNENTALKLKQLQSYTGLSKTKLLEALINNADAVTLKTDKDTEDERLLLERNLRVSRRYIIYLISNLTNNYNQIAHATNKALLQNKLQAYDLINNIKKLRSETHKVRREIRSSLGVTPDPRKQKKDGKQ